MGDGGCGGGKSEPQTFSACHTPTGSINLSDVALRIPSYKPLVTWVPNIEKRSLDSDSDRAFSDFFLVFFFCRALPFSTNRRGL